MITSEPHFPFPELKEGLFHSDTRKYLGDIIFSTHRYEIYSLVYGYDKANEAIIVVYEFGFNWDRIANVKYSANNGFPFWKAVYDIYCHDKLHVIASSRNICSKCNQEIKQRQLFNSSYIGCMC